VEHDGQPIKYYIKTAERMREQEKVTMYIDFAHLASFQHQDLNFMQTVVPHFYKFEPNLRAGLTKFMQHGEGNMNAIKKSYYQVAIYNLP